MKKSLLLFSALLTILSLSARPKDGHYAEINGKSGEALFEAIKTCANKGYGSLGYDNLEAYFPKTDNLNGKVWDMYSNCNFEFSDANCNQNDFCQCWNKEHSIPKSWWGGGTSNQGCDLFHLIPTDARVNNLRSAYAYGEVGTVKTLFDNGSKLGASNMSGWSGTVFEPTNEYKGDLARGYLGTLVKWKLNATSGDGSSTFSGNFTSSGNYGLTAYGVTFLMKWHRNDVVSQKELDRNDSIEATQGNRNPFIDYPELAEYLWGTKKGQTVVLSELTSAYDGGVQVDVPTLFSPTDNSDIQFGNVTLEKTISKSITVKGALLENAISFSISGEDASQFTVSPSTVTAAQANAGQPVAVIYTPATEGLHSATLYLSSQDFTTIAIHLEGTGVISGDDDDPIEIPGGDYLKVTADRDSWEGTYLIVYEDAPYCFDASLEDPDKQGNFKSVTISDNTIQGTDEINKCAVIIQKAENAYTIKSASTGNYYGNESGNDILASTEPYLNTIQYQSASAIITCNNTIWRFNKGDGVGRFRYFKSTSWANQQAVQLYRKQEPMPTDVENCNNHTLLILNNTLQLTTTQPADVIIYDYTGRTILHKTGISDLQTHLPQGIYVVQVNEKTQKIWVK